MDLSDPNIPILGRHQVIDPSPCPACGAENDGLAVTANVPRRPSPGDIVLCTGCGTPVVFGDGLRLRKITKAEAMNIAQVPEFLVGFFLRWCVDNVEGFSS